MSNINVTYVIFISILLFFIYFLYFFTKNKEFIGSTNIFFCECKFTNSSTLKFTYMTGSDLIIVRQWLYILQTIEYPHIFFITPISNYTCIDLKFNLVHVPFTHDPISCFPGSFNANLLNLPPIVNEHSFLMEEDKYSSEFIKLLSILNFQDSFSFVPSLIDKIPLNNITLENVNSLLLKLQSDLNVIFFLEKKKIKSFVLLRKFIFYTPCFVFNFFFIRLVYKCLFLFIVYFFYFKEE